ncbi:PREDICTED: uncharacterized protein LOC101300027 [Fragaria vesca subsp. vesca]
MSLILSIIKKAWIGFEKLHHLESEENGSLFFNSNIVNWQRTKVGFVVEVVDDGAGVVVVVDVVIDGVSADQVESTLVKWLNKQLSKLWSFVADVAEVVIRESVEPLLEEYRLPGITSLKFSKLSLGTVAPKIEGI